MKKKQLRQTPRKTLRTQQLCAAAFALAAGLSFQTAWANCRVSLPAENEMKVDFLNREGLEKVIEMDVQCQRPAAQSGAFTYHVCVPLDGGAANRVQRERYALSGSKNRLDYNIYTDPQHTHIAFTRSRGNVTDNNILHTAITFADRQQSGSGKIYAYVKIPVQTAAAAEYIGDFTQNSSAVISRTHNCRDKNYGGDINGVNDFIIKAKVINSCKIDVPANIDFGEKSVKDQNLIGQTNINVTCSKDHPYQIGLTSKYGDNKGRGKMKHITGSDTIDYSLRQSSSSSDLWGDSGNTAQTQGSRQFIGTGTQQGHAVYATISNIQPNVSAGEYRDTVTVNVYY